MELSTYLTFVLACSILIIIPGPTVAVVIANSLKHGVRIGMVTVAGGMVAMGILLVFVTFGLGAILENLGHVLTYIKWAGVAYLIYIGYKTWTAPSSNLSDMKAERPDPKKIFLRGFIVAISNPKALVFFGAFFPQFINPEGDITAQLALMSVTFFVIALVLDSTWTVMVNVAKKLLMKSEKIVNRVSGGFLMLGGGLLALIKEK
ncbi:MAG: LysE family translocator [OCS116 cluster bacterium]|nr:LysE family translocator [OCS116 cluster bacterium]